MKKLACVALGFALAIAAALLLWPSGSIRDETQEEPENLPQATGLEIVEVAFQSSVEEAQFIPDSGETKQEAALTPEEVIDKQGVGCYLEKGEGPAADLAIAGIWTPEGGPLGGTRFSVLDSSGAIHSGTLPFLSFQTGLGKTRFGQVISGFGGVRPDPETAGLPARGAPMNIYMDNKMIYQKDQVWLFDIADDGSSFFFIEPLGDDYSSRMVIVNLEQGTETHHGLDRIFAHPEQRIRYLASYTPSNAEVHLKPVSGRYSEGLGLHYFFGARAGGSERGLLVPDFGRDDIAHFTSSKELYWLMEADDESDRLQVVKYQVDWSAEKAVPVLNVAGRFGTRANSVQTSPDGTRLLIHTSTANTLGRPVHTSDSGLLLLDAATGEAQFGLAIADNNIQMLALSNVLPASATENDVGRFNGAWFLGNNHLVIRRYPRVDGVIDQTRRLYDVYDLNSISPDSQPQYRTEGNWHWRHECASRGFPGRLFATSEGRLAYARIQP